jgi:hypothetical protein
MPTAYQILAAARAEKARRWHWHAAGRYLRIVRVGWPVPREKKQVWHFDDGHCIARTEEEAHAYFLGEYGEPHKHSQWSFCRGEEIIPKKKRTPKRK